MSRIVSAEYSAKLLGDNGVVRGRIPAPLIRELGGKPGDYIIFKSNGSGSIELSLDRPRKTGALKERATRRR